LIAKDRTSFLVNFSSSSLQLIFPIIPITLKSPSGVVLVSAAAGNKSATRPPLSPPGCGGEWKEKQSETGGSG